MELAELLRSGQINARELVEAELVRLEEQESYINAFGFVDAERALAAAEKISPDDPRPFAGVPIAIKDGTPERGKPMRIGSAYSKTTSPTTTALRSGDSKRPVSYPWAEPRCQNSASYRRRSHVWADRPATPGTTR
jgi:hypothetical protein